MNNGDCGLESVVSTALNPQRTPSVTEFFYPGRTVPFFWYCFLGSLFLLPRLSLLGHPLSWDEAWNLCALRSLAGGGSMFTVQFWRHPPLYMELGLLLAPLRDGFDLRLQMLSLFINLLCFFVFIVFSSRYWGKRIALYAGVSLALMPGAVFFATWTKQDCAVVLLGVLAVWAFFQRREWLSGMLLGLALLAKETAILFAGSFFLLTVTSGGGKNRLVRLAILYLFAMLFCAWWYVLLSKSGKGFLNFFLGTSAEAKGFAEPWWYYWAELYLELGWVGLACFVLGVGVALFRLLDCRSGRHFIKQFRSRRLAPVLILFPPYLLLSLSYGKPPWMTITLQPFLALLIGLGWGTVMHWLYSRFDQKGRRWGGAQRVWVSVLCLGVLLGLPMTSFSYMDYFKEMSPHQVELLRTSYEIADLVNAATTDNAKLLLLPMEYRSGGNLPDPIFYWELRRPLQLFSSAETPDYGVFREAIVRDGIEWILMSPSKGGKQEALLNQFVAEMNPEGYAFSKGILVRVPISWLEGQRPKE